MAGWSEERKQAAKEAYKNKQEKPVLLTKVEEFNGETIPEIDEQVSGMGNWNREDKLNSIINTIKILPPNMIVNGRHIIQNIQAINCFKVTEEMLDEVYKDFKHDEY